MEIKRCYDTVIGASVGENQLINTSANTSTIHGVTFTNNGDGSWTANGENDGTTSTKEIATYNHIGGHKYAITGVPNQSSSSTYRMFIDYVGSIYSDKVFTYNTTATLPVKISIISGYTANNVKFVPQLIDLTTAFGSTIADYIYSLETATAGSGIAKLREWGFLRGYQAYNAGSIESVEVTGKVVRGFNQWDEEWELGSISTSGNPYSNTSAIRSKNFYRCIPNTTYYGLNGAGVGGIYFYDFSKKFIESKAFNNSTFATPQSACYFKMAMNNAYGTTYNHDICISLSSDRNGEYEAYSAQEYDYGDDVLNGIFKLDANNNLYADGDVKTSDGVITRKYGIRAYQSGDESLADAFTNGVQTVYKLTTPTTEQGDPFPSPQICYPDGTEEYTTSNGVPVGHETRYEL